MKITEITAQPFAIKSRAARDNEGHGHPGPEVDAVQTIVTIKTDEGAEALAEARGRTTRQRGWRR